VKIIAAVAAFVEGPLAANPYRVTKALHEPFDGKRSAYRGSYRVMIDIDDAAHVVRIYDVGRRADIYRPR
jgi:mRNA-degrading endonuclease RelE of RelBE toxin-antitoxin system